MKHHLKEFDTSYQDNNYSLERDQQHNTYVILYYK